MEKKSRNSGKRAVKDLTAKDAAPVKGGRYHDFGPTKHASSVRVTTRGHA